jgi:hypothetical protein
MKLDLRMSTEADVPELARFWSDHGGWDRLDAEAWTHRLGRPPFGPAAIVVAMAAGTQEIRGQFAFIPWRVRIGDCEFAAARPFAPILHKADRVSSWAALNPFNHPLLAMYRFGVEHLRSSGAALLYMVPDPRWVRALRLLRRFQSGSFPLFSRALPLPAPLRLGPGYEAAPVGLNGPAVDRLWQHSARLHACQIVRDSQSLSWKVGGGDYEILGLYRGGELVGLVASRQKGDRQWLICDLLANDEASLRATLAAVCNLSHDRATGAPPETPIRKIAILSTPRLEPVLKEFGFERDDYDFPVLLEVLNPVVDKAEVAPDRWYFSAND